MRKPLYRRPRCPPSVYARPEDTRHVLLDDLDADGLDALLRKRSPAAVVETSPACFQA